MAVLTAPGEAEKTRRSPGPAREHAIRRIWRSSVNLGGGLWGIGTLDIRHSVEYPLPRLGERRGSTRRYLIDLSAEYAAMPVEYSAAAEEQFQKLLTRYPDPEAAIIPALHLVQDQEGWVSDDCVEYVAERLSVPPVQVLGVATFYTMFHREPVGRFHIQVCTNVSCSLLASERVVDTIKEALGIGPGQTTEDGLFSLECVECLGSCGTAPVVQVNDDYHEEMTPDRLRELIRGLKAKEQG